MKTSYTILYVDDDADDLEIISEAFLQYAEKLQVVHAHNGLEGLYALEEMKDEGVLPCLVIMDINMPVLNGLDTLTRMRGCAEFANIPVVMFTTSSHTKDQERAARLGADFITKPSRLTDLEGLVEQFVARCAVVVERKH